MDSANQNERVEGRWCVDSETGEQVCLDLKTGQVLARKDRDGNLIPG